MNNIPFLPLLLISMFLLFLSAVITAAFVIPLQWKEAGVKNGLHKLRTQMLWKGFWALITIVSALIILLTRLLTNRVFWTNHAVALLLLVFSVGNLAKAIIDYLIYHQQYSPESKKLHADMEARERVFKKSK